MSQKTHIAWCDSTINFWSGCTKVSPGCAHCYAETRDKRMMIEKVSHWGKGAPRLKHKGAVKDALALNRIPWICPNGHLPIKGAPGGHGPYSGDIIKTSEPCCECDAMLYRRRIFSLSLGDWLDPEVPIEWLAEMLDTIRQCDQVTWILCTKRPELFESRIMDAADYLAQKEAKFETANWIALWLGPSAEDNEDGLPSCNPPKNIILLTSVENQETAGQRIPELLKIPAACRGLSVEPMLGPIDFKATCSGTRWKGCTTTGLPTIDWVIFGGESGDKARPCNLEWIRDGLRQCKAAGVPAFVKQLGAKPITTNPLNERGWPGGFWKGKCKVGEIETRIILNDPKGGDPSEWPEDLRVREFPSL